MARPPPRRSVARVDIKEDPMFTRIVVGVDGRAAGRDALVLATLLRAAPGGELVALHACATEPLLREDVLARVEAELAHAQATGHALVVTDRSPAHALRSIAQREAADLIVIGSSRRAGLERVLAGDDAAATLHCAPCAVAVAPHGLAHAPDALRRVGVGLDGSKESRVALALARRVAHRAGAELRAITVAAPLIPPWPAPAWGPDWSGRWPTDPARRLVSEIAAELDEDVAHEVVTGTAWRELASLSEDLDLLVVGARAGGPVRRLLLGSTSTKLARHAACSLLVTPRGAHFAAGDPLVATARDLA
jgi:nucleotide-binding universal stress UspA family protein